MKIPACWAALVALLVAGCDRALAGVTFERMLDQPRGKPYRASPYFRDGKLMQEPPEGTVPAADTIEPAPVREGLREGSYVQSVPLPVDRALLVRGQNRFETFCAVCHGIDGSGESLVAHNMELRRPPSLLAQPVRDFPAGRVFQVISAGYGLMPAYNTELPVHDRWAVIAYLRALQRSRATELAQLPDAIRREAQRALP